jgi:hypothetical protein
LIVGEFVLLAGLGTQHAREVLGVVAAQDGEVTLQGVDEKSASGHPCRS